MTKKDASSREFNYVPDCEDARAIAKGGVECPFPWRVHEMLKVTADEGMDHIVSWAPHGRAFTVHKPKEFTERVLPRFFSQTKYPSFQRQLNLYGFKRFAAGKDKGAYYHLNFVKGHRSLVSGMVRRKIKGTKVRRIPTEEPDFYDPLWINHFEGTFPPGLRVQEKGTSKQTRKVVSPWGPQPVTCPADPGVQPLAPAGTTNMGAFIAPSVAPSTYVDILPAPPRQNPASIPVSDEESSWESLDLDAVLDTSLSVLEEEDPLALLGLADDDFSLDGTQSIWTDQASFVPVRF